MNNERRKSIRAIMSQMETLGSIIDSIRDELETLRDEESEYLDNMPEAFRDGERGERAQAAIDALEEVISTLEIDVLDMTSTLETACE